MEERRIEVRLHHPLLPILWYQPYRDHRKILAVDRRVAFTGGMNIGDAEWDRRTALHKLGDACARVLSPVL
jgi:phosphatidylserine/phosphatidylglycerophosphate/cardiolipin synthase-like enzyme